MRYLHHPSRKVLVSPANKQKEAKDDIGWTEVTSNQNKDKVVGDMAAVGKDTKGEKLAEGTVEDIVVEEELNDVHEELNVKEKKHEETLIAPPPTRLLKKGKKRNKSRSNIGKRRQKKNSKPPSSLSSAASVPSAAIPTGYYGISTIFVALIYAIPTLLLMRGGKRLYMLLAFIAASYLFKEEMNNFSSIQKEESVGNAVSTSSSGWFGLGSFSFIQGVRALEDCPEQYIANNIVSYDVGSKVTNEEKVYECTESPCRWRRGWKIIGTCVGDVFSLSDTVGSESNLFETDSVIETEDDMTTNLPTSLPMSLGTHSPAAASPPLLPTEDGTLGPECEGSNPQVCGCASVSQADYRGTINTTASGKECIRWDDDSYFNPEEYPDAGLEDNNYCRNPDIVVVPGVSLQMGLSIVMCQSVKILYHLHIHHHPLVQQFLLPQVATHQYQRQCNRQFHQNQLLQCLLLKDLNVRVAIQTYVDAPV